MPRKVFEWDDPGDKGGNAFHIARHGVTTEEAEYVVLGKRNRVERSRSSSHWMTFGSTRTGKYLLVVWYATGENPEVVRVVTSYEVERPRPRRGRR